MDIIVQAGVALVGTAALSAAIVITLTGQTRREPHPTPFAPIAGNYSTYGCSTLRPDCPTGESFCIVHQDQWMCGGLGHGR